MINLNALYPLVLLALPRNTKKCPYSFLPLLTSKIETFLRPVFSLKAPCIKAYGITTGSNHPLFATLLHLA